MDFFSEAILLAVFARKSRFSRAFFVSIWGVISDYSLELLQELLHFDAGFVLADSFPDPVMQGDHQVSVFLLVSLLPEIGVPVLVFGGFEGYGAWVGSDFGVVFLELVF